MNSLARQAAKAALAVGDAFLPRLRGPRILIYHQVGAGLGREMEVTEKGFAAQLDWLSHNARVVDLNQALSAAKSTEADEMVVITFDDGYLDLYEVAWPYLLERQWPFVLYLTTRHIETQRPLTHEQARPLTWDQIGEMLASGLLTLGSHTHTHPDLRLLPESAIKEEFETADELIERRTSIRPQHFAYPWGYWSSPADVVTRTRYQTAALGAPVAAEPFVDDHLVPRLPVQRSDGMALFKMRMRTGLRLEERFRRRLREYDPS
jgi:peptidoglycan/xylan/chitin deacetylase (PgdA/CDA1 family)